MLHFVFNQVWLLVISGEQEIIRSCCPTELVLRTVFGASLGVVCARFQLPLFQAHPQLKQLVRPALERAVQELLPPVVDRSIKISLTTCEQIVKKVSFLSILLSAWQRPVPFSGRNLHQFKPCCRISRSTRRRRACAWARTTWCAT